MKRRKGGRGEKGNKCFCNITERVSWTSVLLLFNSLTFYYFIFLMARTKYFTGSNLRKEGKGVLSHGLRRIQSLVVGKAWLQERDSWWPCTQ